MSIRLFQTDPQPDCRRTLRVAEKVGAVFGLQVIAYNLIPLGNLLNPAMEAA